MGYKVVWTECGLSDAESYAEYIAKDSHTYAAYFTAQIRLLAKSLREMPERGRMVPPLKRADIRELIWGNYRMIYQITETAVYILALEHSARLLDIAALKEKLKAE